MILDEIIQRLGAALDSTQLGKGALASKLGVTTQTLRNWRDGENFPNKNRWLKIEEITKVPLNSIFLGNPDTYAGDPLELQLLILYRGMGSKRDALMDLALALYNQVNPGKSPQNPYFGIPKAMPPAEPPPSKPPPLKLVPQKIASKRKRYRATKAKGKS